MGTEGDLALVLLGDVELVAVLERGFEEIEIDGGPVVLLEVGLESLGNK